MTALQSLIIIIFFSQSSETCRSQRDLYDIFPRRHSLRHAIAKEVFMTVSRSSKQHASLQCHMPFDLLYIRSNMNGQLTRLDYHHSQSIKTLSMPYGCPISRGLRGPRQIFANYPARRESTPVTVQNGNVSLLIVICRESHQKPLSTKKLNGCQKVVNFPFWLVSLFSRQ